MYERVVKTTRFFQILTVLLLLGLFVQLFVGQKVEINNGILTIQKLFPAQIYLTDIIGITERISTKSGTPFYFIETKEGAYEVDDSSFIYKGGKQIIDEIGLQKLSIDEGNISDVYLIPEIFNDIHNYALDIEHIDYNLGSPNRANSLDQRFSDIYMAVLISTLCFFIMTPSAYGFLHPQQFYSLFYLFFLNGQMSQEKSYSLGSAKALSVLLFLTGLLLLIFWYGIMIAF